MAETRCAISAPCSKVNPSSGRYSGNPRSINAGFTNTKDAHPLLLPARLNQHNAVAALVVLYERHVMANEENAAAARSFQVFGIERIGNISRIEAGSLIFDLGDDLAGVDGIKNAHPFVRIFMVA